MKVRFFPFFERKVRLLIGGNGIDVFIANDV